MQRVSAQEASNSRARDQFSDDLRGAHETIAELRSALRQHAERRKEDEDALVRHHRQKIAQLEKDNAVRLCDYSERADGAQGLAASLAEASAKEQMVARQLMSVRAALGLA